MFLVLKRNLVCSNGCMKEELQLKNRRETGRFGKTHSKRCVLTKAAGSILVVLTCSRCQTLPNVLSFKTQPCLLESDASKRSYSLRTEGKRADLAKLTQNVEF